MGLEEAGRADVVFRVRGRFALYVPRGGFDVVPANGGAVVAAGVAEVFRFWLGQGVLQIGGGGGVTGGDVGRGDFFAVGFVDVAADVEVSFGFGGGGLR